MPLAGSIIYAQTTILAPAFNHTFMVSVCIHTHTKQDKQTKWNSGYCSLHGYYSLNK
jgi:hypothetical protein